MERASTSGLTPSAMILHLSTITWRASCRPTQLYFRIEIAAEKFEARDSPANMKNRKRSPKQGGEAAPARRTRARTAGGKS